MSILANQTIEFERQGALKNNPVVGVSVVVPVTERCGDLTEIYRAHAAVLNQGGHSFEFVFVIENL